MKSIFTFRTFRIKNYGCYSMLHVLIRKTYSKFILKTAQLTSQLDFEKPENIRVKELDGVKPQLYIKITQQFRTALTVILNEANQVKSNPSIHLRNRMELIIRNGQSLLNLVNELLDLAKPETGKMQLNLGNGDLINFLRHIIEPFKSLAESQQKHLHFLPGMDTLYILYDSEKIRQIVDNLLYNALKFTPEKGNIYVSVNEGAVPRYDQSATFIIRVTDTGIGMPEGQIQHVFEPFYRLANVHVSKANDTGRGLAFTKELVELMNGEITARSPATGAIMGSEFTVIVPFEKLSKDIKENIYPENKDEYLQKISSPVAIVMNAKKQIEKTLIPLPQKINAQPVYNASCLPGCMEVDKVGRAGFVIAAEIIPGIIATDKMIPFLDGDAHDVMEKKISISEYEREDEFVKKIRLSVETHLADESFTVDQLCKLFFISRSQLHRKLDALTGSSPNRFIRIIRLKKARELLKNGSYSIGSIAQGCGYNDAGYFARIFKHEYGLTPQEWRANNKHIT